MHTLVIDMPSGVAGDMLLAALLDAAGPVALPWLQQRIDGLRLSPHGVAISGERVLVGGLTSLRVTVDAPQTAQWIDLSGTGSSPSESTSSAHSHRPYRDIRTLLDRLELPPQVRERAQQAFRLLAEAEAEVHGCVVDAIEFHEVGSVDAIVDVLGVCWMLDYLQIDRVWSGPLLPGSGTVACAHGRMPVPVPAVARMLVRTLPRAGVRPPMQQLSFVTGELTTPTGAALVCSLADAFISDEPGHGPGFLRGQMVATGYGAGHKTIAGLVNVVRVQVLATATQSDDGILRDDVVELRCQLDDMTGEALAVACERIRSGGALDVWLTPIVMKKGRPGHALTVLAAPEHAAEVERLILTVTTTLGVRRSQHQRAILPRAAEQTNDGRAKMVVRPDGSRWMKIEADDLAQAPQPWGDFGWRGG